jgi:hypothetical protein
LLLVEPPFTEEVRTDELYIESYQPDFSTEVGGTLVVLRGRGEDLTPPLRVFFGDAEARIERFVRTSRGDKILRAVAPPHPPGTVDVRLVKEPGWPHAWELILEEAFTYLPVAQVVSAVPTRVRSEGGDVVTVLGDGFHAGVRVLVDEQPAAVERLSSTHLRVTVPPHPAGKVALTVVNFPEMPQRQETRVPDALEVLAPSERLRTVVAARLVDLETAAILDARVLDLTAEIRSGESLDGEVRAQAQALADALPLDERVRSGAVWVAPLPGPSPETGDVRLLARELADILTRRGLSVAVGVNEEELRSEEEYRNRAGGISPLRAAVALGRQRGTSWLLTLRPLASFLEDVRDLLLDPESPSFARDAEAELLIQAYQRLESLARALPEPAEAATTIAVRLFSFPAEERVWAAAEMATEEAVIAGLASRMRVMEKFAGPAVKPAWLYGVLAGPSDPLAYTSWAEFRRAHPGVESVFFYRADARGLYGRLVDAAAGVVAWSGRLLPAQAILAGEMADSPHDDAQKAAEQVEWSARVGVENAVWVSPMGSWQERTVLSLEDVEYHEGIVSALVQAGVAVLEPMVTAYRARAGTDGRAALVQDDADLWAEIRLMGATRLLEYERAVPAAPVVPGTCTFRIRDIADGAVLAEWTVSEPMSQEETTDVRELP